METKFTLIIEDLTWIYESVSILVCLDVLLRFHFVFVKQTRPDYFTLSMSNENIVVNCADVHL